ncbi:MAG: TadE/TadG family type IV pilus assembly protein [Candidatus Dormiibacterota bacterium]|jgi:Flp pilus assembly protein TadG
MVEFAVILPVLLVIGMSVFDYGYYLEHVNNIATVVRDGARYASVYTNPSYNTQWSSACANPTILASGGWSCAGLETTVSATQPTQAIDPSSGTYTIQVASISGFSTYDDGFTVATTTSTGVAALINCSGTATVSGQAEFTACSATDPATGGGNLVASAPLIGQSDFTEGVIQEEAESLTVPEGGLPIDNIDCCWSGSSGGSGCPSGGTTPPAPSAGSTVILPTAWPVSGMGAQAPVSCVTISYWTSSDLSYSTASLSLCGWWSADANNDTGYFENVNNCSATIGKLVQVTVAYAWSQESPGPVFTVLNSIFGLQVDASATTSFVVTGGEEGSS